MPRCDVRVRQAHHAHPRADEIGHREELAERHEVALVVGAGGLAERQERVAILVALLVVGQDADEELGVERARELPAGHRGSRARDRPAPGSRPRARSRDPARLRLSVIDQYSSIVARRSPGSHFRSCGIAPCTSETRSGAPAGSVQARPPRPQVTSTTASAAAEATARSRAVPIDERQQRAGQHGRRPGSPRRRHRRGAQAASGPSICP